MAEFDGSRFDTELELLQAMYPEQLEFDPKSRDLKFSDGPAFLHMRIPELYPDTGLPDVLSAGDGSRNDMRDSIKSAIRHLDLVEGEEVLDSIVACFQGLIAATATATNATSDSQAATKSKITHTPESNKTVIIWLHHLLATGKRKLAISPSSPVSGITKPGYPGIMVFAGPAPAVAEHVNTLKAQNWQAFQVRFEEDVLWEFAHAGVVEVETMGQVAKAIEVGPGGAERKEEFLKAAGIK